MEGICIPCDSLKSAPPVVVEMRLPEETGEVTDVTVVASVAPTAKNNTCFRPHCPS